MRWVRGLLIFHTVFEVAVAVGAGFFPQALIPDLTPGAIALGRVLAGNALGLAVLGGGLVVQPARVGLAALLVFHSAVTIAQLTNVLAGTAPFPVVLVHGTLAIAFGVVVFSNQNGLR